MPKWTNCVWMQVTKDAYSLPLVVCDTATELAKKCGVNVQSIYQHITRAEQGKIKKVKYVRVHLEDE